MSNPKAFTSQQIAQSVGQLSTLIASWRLHLRAANLPDPGADSERVGDGPWMAGPDSRLTDAELRVAVGICAHVKDRGRQLSASQETIAGWCGKSRRSIRDGLPRLIDAGLLTVETPPSAATGHLQRQLDRP